MYLFEQYAWCCVSSKPRGSPRICILGAGVNGLATALRLQQALPSARLTIYADKFGSDLTSHGAAGVWQPYKLSETPEVLTHRWGAETFTHLMELVHSPEAVQAGVEPMYCNSLFLAEEPDPFWASTVSGFQRMRETDLALFSKHVDWPSIQAAAAVAAAAAASSYSPTDSCGPGDGSIDAATAAENATAFVDGYSFNTVVCEGRLYMRWLSNQLDAAGVTQQQRRLRCLSELAGEGWDLVINCCGLGSRDLLPDPHCYPIRGQIMRVRAPWVSQCVFAEFPDETSYIIPNREWVVLGGTGQVGNFSSSMALADAEKIAGRALQVVPSLAHAELLDHWVGLRPGRVRLRLEAEVMSPLALAAAAEAAGVEPGSSTPGSGRLEELRLVHNYGHGGSGLTLAWGTAGDAVQLALSMLQGGAPGVVCVPGERAAKA
ncbi:hypothetical protein OEZ86_013690 [Tetradesmus obliquus]|nr:hypothetical protein OEZ86_013690 [Tetradesmus obliquus]